MALPIFLIILLFSCGITPTQAEETDQFTLPPNALQDIGPIVSGELYEVLNTLINRTNSEIQDLIPRAQQSKYAASQLALRLNGSYLVDLFYAKTSPGFPHWLRWTWSRLRKQKGVSFNEVRPWKRIYWLVFSQNPLFQLLAPTINMYGYSFGTDKLNHFFMQGHSYYAMYNYYLGQGKSTTQAYQAMIRYGQVTEQSYLGVLATGIYSNGDLSANYAGWKFYRNFVHNVKIGKRTLSPLLVLNGYQWEFARRVRSDTLLKPYLSDNLNEALNPSHFVFMRKQIHRSVKKRCDDWIARQDLTQQWVKEKLKETSLWHGANYGHWLPARGAVTLEVCFEEK
ncbi:MAG: hypothetical protein WC785_08235 [Tatlockia sp.]|jgi:hypothetical protein